MAEQTQNNENFFYGVMLLKEGKWAPHSKYNMDSFGSALIKAEELSAESNSEGVKLLKVTAGGNPEPQEMWISPHLKARAEAKAAAQVRDGVKKTQQNLADAHAKRKAEIRGN